ncbi:DUF4292 domain-containing protein [Solitalea sp. MAHUQ-68]|uniref:DUF4292 domain-containing protein n=1 Tax=Solitalea agri TaxID=2953739 RepID=A0A9X2JF87_9SPHI|nr:DUF4292 domain-containing protein [Solitalea agri]MCO4293141.1 DUF4292 domain-containing protein [Solitalea agri]
MIKPYTNKFFVLLTVLGLFSTACRPKKAIVETGPLNKKELTELEKAKLKFEYQTDSTELSFDYFSGKAKAVISTEGREDNATINLRIKKDEIIWASVSAFGFEAARAYITPDSIKVLVRLGKNSYINKGFDYIQQMTNKKVDFKTLQAILVGNKVRNFVNPKDDFKVEDLFYIITGEDEGLKYKFNYNNQFKTDNFTIDNSSPDQHLIVSYGNYSTFNSRLVPLELSISSQTGDKKLGVYLRYNKITVNEPLEFPFSVPKRFN